MVLELVKNHLGQQGPLRHTGQVGQQGNSQMGTASQQQHANQPGQHSSEPYALTAPGFLQNLETTSRTDQRAIGPAGYMTSSVRGESPAGTTVADSVHHGDTSIWKRPPQHPNKNPTGIHRQAVQAQLETSPEAGSRYHRGGTAPLPHTPTQCS